MIAHHIRRHYCADNTKEEVIAVRDSDHDRRIILFLKKKTNLVLGPKRFKCRYIVLEEELYVNWIIVIFIRINLFVLDLINFHLDSADMLLLIIYLIFRLVFKVLQLKYIKTWNPNSELTGSAGWFSHLTITILLFASSCTPKSSSLSSSRFWGEKTFKSYHMKKLPDPPDALCMLNRYMNRELRSLDDPLHPFDDPLHHSLPLHHIPFH